MIQEGVLYSSWLTTEDKIEKVVIDLETGKKLKFPFRMTGILWH